MSGNTTSSGSLISSGNYLIDTLYLYSRNTGYVIGAMPQAENNTPDNLCINALQFIFNEAKTDNILNPDANNNHIDAVNPVITNLFGLADEDDKSGVATVILNTFFTAFARLQTNLFDLDNKFDIVNTINNFNLYAEQDNQKFKLIDTLREHYKPSQVYEKISEKTNYIQTTFDYVLFLFSISMAKNWHANWINTEDIDKNNDEHTNLRRRNFMIVSFLSIFTAYFKPILDNLVMTQSTTGGLPEEYTRIIAFINKIIYLHNSILDGHTEITPNKAYNTENRLTNTTYHNNKKFSEIESEKHNKKTISNPLVKGDISYKLLENYNEYLIEKNEFTDKSIPEINEVGVSKQNLKPSNGIQKTEILLPELPSAAAWNPILTRKMGLAGVEINKVLNDINLGMCKSEISLSSSETQFKVTGIPFADIYYIHNYLFNIGDDITNEYLENYGMFSMLNYFESILKFHHPEIIKFQILTAINNHYDQIYFTKVGSFDLHISPETYKKVILECKSDSKFMFITGIQAYKVNKGFFRKLKHPLRNIENLQATHRVMLIFDMTKFPGKIYYFEPFGQFYPVYDMYGRLIPDMQERVISGRLGQMFNALGLNNAANNPNIILPYENNEDVSKYCNTGIFNLSRAAYLGYGDLNNSIINSVINSTKLHDDKTLDWVSGYCGLIVIFMMVMIKINCDMQPDAQNKRTVDDILIWFGEFNSNPFFTFDNLLSRFILRGFGKLVENILNGKQTYIQPIKFDLADAKNIEKFRVDSQGQLIAKTTEHLKHEPNNLKPELTNILYNLIGINPELIGSDVNNEKIRTKLNSIVQFIYTILPHIDNNLQTEIINSDGIISKLKLETNTDLDDKLFKVKDILRTKPKQSLVPIRVGSVFGSWISNFFSKKGKVYIDPLAANNAIKKISSKNPFLPDAKTKILNTNPKIPRVLFIDIQPKT